jgi:hypothetical protein
MLLKKFLEMTYVRTPWGGSRGNFGCTLDKSLTIGLLLGPWLQP